jgi:hypothetical protein
MQHTFFVPVRAGQAGVLALRTGRLPSGERVGLAFTSETALSQTLGPAQQWVHLAAPALAAMLAPDRPGWGGTPLRVLSGEWREERMTRSLRLPPAPSV